MVTLKSGNYCTLMDAAEKIKMPYQSLYVCAKTGELEVIDFAKRCTIVSEEKLMEFAKKRNMKLESKKLEV